MFSIRKKFGEWEVEQRLDGAELLAFISFFFLVCLPWALLFGLVEPSRLVTTAVITWLAIGSVSGLIAATGKKQDKKEMVTSGR